MATLRRLLLFTSALLCAAAPLRAQSNVAESAAFTFDTRDYTTGLAAESATFDFDTRIVDGLGGNAVSESFVFDTRGTTPPPLQITGVLRDSAGVPVAGAMIQIKRAGAIFWQGVSGAGGTFTTPNLSGVNYTVIVTKAGYQTAINNITGTAGGSLSLTLQTPVLPNPLSTQDVSRAVASGALRVITPGSLLVFNGTDFVSPFVSPPDPTKDTLVLTHGMLSNPDAWAKQMAVLVKARFGAQAPNIIAWDWHDEAGVTVFNGGIIVPVDHAMPQGLLLGPVLQQWLGTNYNHHVHFVGHSLGTIVNKYACDYVHRMLDQGNPPTAWNKASTAPHVTLLDEAELASIAGTNVSVSSVQSWLAKNSLGIISPPTSTGIPYWKSPIPRAAAWIDNYISAVGFVHSEAVNVWLLHPLAASELPIAAHSYAWLWYSSTVSPLGAPPSVGFDSWIAGTVPPASPAAGTLFFENIATSDPLDLTTDPSVVYSLGLTPSDASIPYQAALPVAVGNVQQGLGGAVLDGYQTSVKWVKTTGTTVVQKVGAVSTAVGQKIGLGLDATLDFEWDVINAVNPELQLISPLSATVFKLILQTQPPAPSPAAGSMTAAAAPPTGQPAYAWITIPVPSDAGAMAFDFTVTGDPASDSIACAINDQNVFMLPAKLASVGKPMSTDMIDVSAYAGQNIELFFGLAGGTSTNCQVVIDGLRFITVPMPKVGVAMNGNAATVKWPAAASGWMLEYSDTLAPGSWQPVPFGSGVSFDSGVATLIDPISSLKKFYRLRRDP